MGIPIFGSDFWDPHWKRKSDPVYDSEDSGRNFFSRILMSGESENWNSDSKIRNSGPHKQSNTNSFVNTKVHGRKPSPYKMAGGLFSRQTYIYSHLTENEPTPTHT